MRPVLLRLFVLLSDQCAKGLLDNSIFRRQNSTVSNLLGLLFAKIKFNIFCGCLCIFAHQRFCSNGLARFFPLFLLQLRLVMHNATLSFTFTFFLHHWEAGRQHNSGLMEFLRPNFFSRAVIRIVVIGVNRHVWLVFAQQDNKLFGTVLCHAGWCFTHMVHRIDHQAIHIWIRKRSYAHAGLIGDKFLPKVSLLVPLWHPAGSSMPSDKPKRITIGFRRLN